MSQNIPLAVPQGDTFTRTWQLLTPEDVPVSLAGYSARMCVRRRYTTPVVLEASSANNRIRFNRADGIVIVEITPQVLSSLVPGRYYYDLALTAQDGSVTQICKGEFLIEASVTR